MMGIRGYNRSYNQIKADQEWEMAGLARQDGDMKAAAEHSRKAREWEALEAEAQRR